MNDSDTKVLGEPEGSVTEAVADVTPAGGVEATPALTPTPTPTDADKLAEAKLAEVEALKLKYEQDIGKLKSTFQKTQAQREKEWAEAQARYNAELEQLRLSTMDDEQRKQYESTAATRRVAEMEKQLAELRQRNEQSDRMLKAHQYFLKQGVPADKLVTDEGYDELWNSGMGWITDELGKLRTGGQKSQQPAAPNPSVSAPKVVTQTNTPAYQGTSWEELIKKYGDEETVYRLVETGQLSPSIIPVKRKE